MPVLAWFFGVLLVVGFIVDRFGQLLLHGGIAVAIGGAIWGIYYLVSSQQKNGDNERMYEEMRALVNQPLQIPPTPPGIPKEIFAELHRLYMDCYQAATQEVAGHIQGPASGDKRYEWDVSVWKTIYHQHVTPIHAWYTHTARVLTTLYRGAASPPIGISAAQGAANQADAVEYAGGLYIDPNCRYVPELTPQHLLYWSKCNGILAFRQPVFEQEYRFEHEWFVAPSGMGKTTFLREQILDDFKMVEENRGSVIVMDSQRVFIDQLSRLKCFGPGGSLEGKLVVLEPDAEYPPALNVLDVGLPEADIRARFMMQAEALENVKACLSTMNDMQDDMLSYMVELAFVIPGATIETLADMLKPNGIKPFQEYLQKVDKICRDYFETTFTSQGSGATKDALTRRLRGMLKNPTFRQMFTSPVSKFSMSKELQESKVILIDTDMAFLQKEACQLFGRFFIAQLLQAAQSRGPDDNPVFFYIDEASDYIADDDNIAILLDKARKRRVGLILAHQRMIQITSPNVRDALANVHIRIAGGNETDAPYLANVLHSTKELISLSPQGQFLCYVRKKRQEAFALFVNRRDVEYMTDEERERIRYQMRAKYGVNTPVVAPIPPPRPTAPTEPLLNLHYPDLPYRLEKDPTEGTDEP